MTEAQAADILRTLLMEMENNGYGEIVRQTTARFNEEFASNTRDISNISRVRFYLGNIVDIFESRSSSKLPAIVNRINDHLGTEYKIGGIEVIIDEERYDLAELPDYKELIEFFTTINNEISQQ